MLAIAIAAISLTVGVTLFIGGPLIAHYYRRRRKRQKYRALLRGIQYYI